MKYLRIGFEGVFRESYAHFYYEKNKKRRKSHEKATDIDTAFLALLAVHLRLLYLAGGRTSARDHNGRNACGK
jgi:hypothetical protein